MDWLTGGKAGDAKRLLAHLADVTKRDNAAQDLIRIGEQAVPVLLDALQTKDLNLLPIYQRVLAHIPSASPALIKTLATAHPVLRGRVAEIFSVSKDPAAVPALLDALQGEYYTVRSRAAIALGRIGDPKAIEPLLSALKDREDEVRIAACLALGLFKTPTTFDDITNVLLDDPKIEVRQAAAEALGNTGHPKAVPCLMEALRDPFWWYEREVQAGDLLNALEKMGNAAVEPLIEALQDKEGTVRKFSATLLGRLGDARAIEPLGMALYDLHHEVGNVSAQALAEFGAPAIGVLTEALRHPELWIRIHAVNALRQINDSQIPSLLLGMLDDPEREVRKAAIQSLGELKDPRIIPTLERIATDRTDREMAALAKQAMDEYKSTDG